MTNLFELRRAELPWPLTDQLVLADEGTVALWFDAFRLHSRALLFSSTLIWNPEDTSDDGDDWPDLTGTRPGRQAVRIQVVADGERWENDPGSEQTLDFFGASAVPGFATASWWLPFVPQTLKISVQADLIGGAAEATMDASSWRELAGRARQLQARTA